MAESINRTGSASHPAGQQTVYSRKSSGPFTSGNGVYDSSYPTYLNGEKNPRWRGQISRGQNASTPFEALKVWHTFDRQPHLSVIWDEVPGVTTPATAFIECDVQGYSFKNALFTDNQVKSISISTASNEAASLFHRKVNDAFRHIQAGVIAGEWRETQRLIKNRGSTLFGSTTSLADSIHDWIRRNRRLGNRARRIRDLLSTVSDLWLEYSFGVAPLVNDIEGAIDYYNDHSTTLSKKVRAIADHETQYGGPFYTYVGTIGCARIKVREERYKTASVLLYGEVGLRDQNSLNLKKKGLHPSDFVPTIYELIPYSFLVDYFTNLNGIIAAVGNLALDVKWSSRTYKRKFERRSITVGFIHYDENTAAYYGRPTILAAVPQSGSTFKEVTYRDPIYSVPVPGLEFSLPDSPLQWLNMAALYGARSETRRLVSNL